MIKKQYLATFMGLQNILKFASLIEMTVGGNRLSMKLLFSLLELTIRMKINYYVLNMLVLKNLEHGCFKDYLSWNGCFLNHYIIFLVCTISKCRKVNPVCMRFQL